ADKTVLHRIVEGFDAEEVAREHDGPALCIQQREREHAHKTPQGRSTPLRPGGQQHLGVRLRPETMAEFLQFQAKFLVVVDLTVVYHVVAAIGRAHRLPSRIAGIYDGEAAMQQQDLRFAIGWYPLAASFNCVAAETQP